MVTLGISRNVLCIGSLFLISFVIPGCIGGECFLEHCGSIAHHGGHWQNCLRVSDWQCNTDEFCKIDFTTKDVSFHCHSKDKSYEKECLADDVHPDGCSLYHSLRGRGANIHCRVCCETRSCILNLAIENPSTSTVMPSTAMPSTVRPSTAMPSTVMPSTAMPSTPASTLDPMSVDYLLKECPDLLNPCDDTICTDYLAPTLCRRHCGFCDYPSFVLKPSALSNTTQQAGHVTSGGSSKPTTPLTIPTSSSSPPSLATVTAAAQTSKTMTSPHPQSSSPLSTAGQHVCEDRYSDCASIPFACQSDYAYAVCQKYCNLCASSTAETSTIATTIQQSTTSCMDQLPVSVCTAPDTSCADAITGVLCAKTCQKCKN